MAKALEKPSLYDRDYVAWLAEQVAHLRAGRLAALDVENVALELEGLMNSQRQQLENRLEVLILHLLEWDHQPDQRSNRWRSTVQEQRTRIRRLLRFSPSLKREVEPMCRDVYPDAVRAAVIETQTLDKPSLCATDYIARLESQVAHLSAGRLRTVDVELENLMNQERRRLANCLEVLMLNLRKWDHRPGAPPVRWRPARPCMGRAALGSAPCATARASDGLCT